MALQTTDGSKTLYSYAAEVTAGVPPATDYQTLRVREGVRFDLNRETSASNELRADRMESAVIYGKKSGDFTLPVEWSYGTFDDFLEATLGGTWTADVLKIGNNVRTFTIEETATDIGITEQKRGCQFGGFTISQKDVIPDGEFTGVFRDLWAPQTKGVDLAYDATAKTITRASDGFITIDGWEIGNAVLGTGNADPGNNNTTPWIITDLTDSVMTFTTAPGMVTAASTSGIVLNQGTIATSLTSATTTQPFNSFTGTITEGGSLIAHVTGWELNVSQEINPNFAVTSAVTQSVSVGKVKVSGNMTVYYIDQALRRKFLNGTSSSLSLVLGSVGNGQAYTFEMGTVSYTSNTRDHSPLARVESLDFTATYTDVDSTSLKITRTP